MIGLLLLAVGLDLRAHPRRLPGRPARAVRYQGTVMAVFAVAWTLLAGVAVFGSNFRLARALREGRFERVEGTVRGFVADDAYSHRDLRWEVVSGSQVHRYGYGSTHRAADPRLHGESGALRDGMHVRIADVDGRIARLEACP